MTDEQLTREGLRAWRAQGVPVDAERATRQRGHVVNAIAEAIRRGREQRRSRQRRTAWISAVALAAVAVIGITGWLVIPRAGSRARTASAPSAAAVAVVLREAQGTVVADRAGHSELVAAEHALELTAGDAVSTLSDARARLILPGDGLIRVGSSTDLRIQESRPNAQRLGVGLGHIEVSLPRQTPTRTLVVTTPDAEVAVVGTEFAVDVCRRVGEKPGFTEVKVTRGVVRVLSRARGTALIARGESWSSDGFAVGREPCARTPVEPSVSDSASAAPEARRSLPAVRGRGSPLSAATKGELAIQNRLYQEALDARNAGDDAKALALLGELLAKYPESPLRQEAQVERMRALKRSGELGEAARTARRYLAEHAAGFARDEAQELIWGPEPTDSKESRP